MSEGEAPVESMRSFAGGEGVRLNLIKGEQAPTSIEGQPPANPRSGRSNLAVVERGRAPEGASEISPE